MFTRDLVANGFNVTAVGSRTASSAEAFAREHGIGKAHGSYEQLVADDQVDVVYVSTPHPYHAENAELALNAGKHVLVEKPFALNAAQARRVVELAQARGLVVLEAMWTRWLPTMTRIRELLAAGAIGQLRTLIADHTQRVPVDHQGRLYNPELGGGALLDLGIYPVSFAWDLFGEPATVQALSTPTATGVDAETSIMLGFPGGKQAILHTALDLPGPNRASLLGTDGRIEIDAIWYTPASFTVFDAANEVVERFEPSGLVGRGMHYQALELERLVAEGAIAGETLSPEATVAILETLDEIRRQIGLRYPGEPTA